MTRPEDVAAVREAVALSRLDHVAYVRVRGESAYPALDRIFPSALRMRDGQMLHTLLLDERAHPIADVHLCWDDEEFFLLADGLPPDALMTYLRDHLPTGSDVELEDLSESHAILSLDGPYAWELLGIAVDPEAIGLPYLTFYHRGDWICYRAGRTGEFGYGLIVPRGDVESLTASIHAAGTGFDLREVGLDTLDQCALENWFFNIRREGRQAVTPIELQLQWRVSYQKEFVGSEALRRRRAERPAVRLTCLLGKQELALGAKVFLSGAAVGSIVNAGYSHVRDEWIGLALIETRWAHPGIDAFRVADGEGQVAARSVSPPVLLNRSLGVSPQLHSYATRHERPVPSLVRP